MTMSPPSLWAPLMPDANWREQIRSLPMDVIRSPDGSPYMERFFVRRNRRSTIRYHHLLTSDPDRDLHDHPWDFNSLILEGGYRELTVAGEREFPVGSRVSHLAEETHRLTMLDGPTWTLVQTGGLRRQWGFQTPQGWVHWKQYKGVT